MPIMSGRCFFIGLVVALVIFAAPTKADSPFCSDADCKATRKLFEQLCDFIVDKKSNVGTIYTGGYYMRTLVAGYEILGEQRYLDVAIGHADGLLRKQMPRGYWGTGYGDVYLADTGSALGLFIALYKHVDNERQKKYLDAVQKYITAVEKDGLIFPSGALAVGWQATEDGTITGPIKSEYTISSALTGVEIFTWMYHITKADQYRQVAFNALHWILSTMRKDGVIPYVAPFEGAVLGKTGEPTDSFLLWEEYPYLTSTYVGEGLICFDLYCDRPEWKAEVRRAIRPHIQFLLRTQNSDGTWGKRIAATSCGDNQDQTRSPGVTNLLIWYYEHVDGDARIVKAVRRFDQLLLDPGHAKAFGLLNAGAPYIEECSNSNTVTSLTGRSVADILVPDITSKW